MNITLLIIAALLVISAATLFDFLVYMFRPSPKVSYFSKLFWRVGFLSIIALVYFYLNGMKFF